MTARRATPASSTAPRASSHRADGGTVRNRLRLLQGLRHLRGRVPARCRWSEASARRVRHARSFVSGNHAAGPHACSPPASQPRRARLLQRRVSDHAADRDHRVPVRVTSRARGASCRSRASTAPWESASAPRSPARAPSPRRRPTASLYMAENVFAAGFFRLPVVMMARQPHARPAVEHLGGPRRHADAARRRLDPVLLRRQPGSGRHHPARLPPRRGRARLCCRSWCARTRSCSRTRMMMTDLPEQEQVDAFLPAARPCRTACSRPATRGRRPRLARTRPRVHREQRIEAAWSGCPPSTRSAGRVREGASADGRPTRSCPTAWTTPRSVLSHGHHGRTVRTAVDAARRAASTVGRSRVRMFRPVPRERSFARTRAGAAHRGDRPRPRPRARAASCGREMRGLASTASDIWCRTTSSAWAADDVDARSSRMWRARRPAGEPVFMEAPA